MPDTTYGFTYPAVTEAVADGAAAIQALAEDTDRRFSIGTTLPAAPVNGQEAVLVDSLTAPTYAWRFRYLSSITGANKWLFVGGPPAVKVGGGGNITNAAYADWPTNNPAIVIPRAGDYVVRHGATFYGTVAGSFYISATRGNVVSTDLDCARWENAPGTQPMSLSRSVRMAGLAAGGTVKTQARATAGTLVSYADSVFLDVTPVAVA